MRKLFLGTVLLSLFALPLMAQDKVEVFGGYQYLHIGQNTTLDTNGQGFNGWNAAAAYNFRKHIGVEGDFSGTYATVSGVSWHVYTYAGGPVVSMPMGRIKPFAHVLFGGVKLSESDSGVSASESGFTTMFGGGVDVKAIKNISVRLAQVDWLYYHFGSTTIATVPVPSFSGSNNVRISTGVVFHF